MPSVRYYREPSKALRGQQIAEHRRKVKRKAVDYSGGKCLRCGYDTCEASLTFHHLDPTEKEHGLASGNTWGWDKMKKEIDKTLLVCHNCHAEHHAGIWQPSKKMIEVQKQIRKNYEDKPLVDYCD